MSRRAIVALAILLTAGAAVYAQDFFRSREPRRQVYEETTGNQPYDGRVVFLRVRYGGFGGFGRGRREPPWAHDYPTSDTHMMKILNEITLARPRMDGSNVHGLDEPDLFQFPIAYMSEPGFWAPSDEEARGLRSYLLKGGFIIFDDFRDWDWDNLVQQMQRVVPELRWVQLDSTHRIFHSFFEIDDLNYLTSYGNQQPTYWGLFENNDPAKRLMAIADRDGDLGEYWEFSDTGYVPVDLSNTAYKFGVNYFIYGLTH
jgi:hypothetical protein